MKALRLAPLRLVRSSLLPAVLALAGLAQAAEPPRPPITVASEEAFWWGDFPAIERQNALYRQPNRFDPDGAAQLDRFRDDLGNVFGANIKNAEAYHAELDRLTLQWANEHPKSALAHALHARALVAHGWSYRGGGYIREVTPEALEQFHAYLMRAVKYLDTHAEVALTDSYTHQVLLKIGTALSWEDKQMSAILEDGLKRNPDDISLYFEAVESLLPKWGGDASAIDKFIRRATEQTRHRFGSGMYARLYSYVAASQYRHALFEDSHADWTRMKQGYEDMFARFPDSPARLNRYAYMACLAKDKPVLLTLLGKLGTKIDTSEWGTNPERNLEACRRWASQT